MTCTVHNVHLGTRRIRFRKETFPKIFVDKIKILILCSITSFLKIELFMKYCGKNMVEPDTEHMIMLYRTCAFDCWLDKARDLHSIYVQN
jgi:hypothetical protein